MPDKTDVPAGTPPPSRKQQLDDILLDPFAHFDTAGAVLESPLWSRDEKRRILESMAEDAVELCVAETENMGGGEKIDLKPIKDALRVLAQDGYKST